MDTKKAFTLVNAFQISVGDEGFEPPTPSV